MTPSKSIRGHYPSPTIAALAAVVVSLAACGKDEAQVNQPRAAAPVQAPQAATAAPAQATEAKAAPDANEALKERLARQEAASKLFEKPKPEPAPAPAKTPVPAPAPEKAAVAPAKSPAASAKAAAPAPVPVPAPAKPEPVKVAEPVKAPEPAKAPEMVPVKLAAAPAASAPAVTLAKLVSRVDVEFPREAIQAGAERGNVKARMTLDGAGNVTRVDVVEATPRRVFDRAVVRSLSQWRFNEGAAGRTVETEVEFKR